MNAEQSVTSGYSTPFAARLGVAAAWAAVGSAPRLTGHVHAPQQQMRGRSATSIALNTEGSFT
jgi:hypothetical protein